MATLKLVWIKCTGLAAGQSITVTPVFSNVPVSSPSGPAIVTLTDSNPVSFQAETKVDFSDVSGFIYLETADGAKFFSDAFIQDRTNISEETSFGIQFDPTGKYTHLDLVVYYDLKAIVAASSRR
jgi:hypothetical protein